MRTTVEMENFVQGLVYRKSGAEPWPLYRQLLAEAPFRSEALRGWVVTRYEHVKSIMRSPSAEVGYADQMDRLHPDWQDHDAMRQPSEYLGNLDPPEHDRIRAVVTRHFSKSRVEGLRGMTREQSWRLVGELRSAGGGDFLESVAFEVPVGVIGGLLGVPVEERRRFRELIAAYARRVEPGLSETELAKADEAARSVRAYWTAAVQRCREDPGDDLLAALVHEAEHSDGELSVPEVVATAEHLFTSGFVTTVSTLANGLRELILTPTEMERARSDPDAFAELPDEILRCVGAFQVRRRVTRTRIDLGGVTIPSGSDVYLLIGAANRDPRVYERPDSFDLTRRHIRSLAFGIGAHTCVGAMLARMEIEEVFGVMLRTCRRIDFADGVPGFSSGMVLLRPEHMRVSVS